MGDGNKKVKAHLLLKIIFYLDLNETYVTSPFRWNLVSIFVLDKFGYSYSFGNSQFSLFHNLKLVGFGSLSGYDNLCLLDIVTSLNEILHVNSCGIKRKLTNENFTLL